MKNRISMALKDPILQQGFEIICKNVAELEKENAELKADNDARKFSMAMSEKVENQLREQIEKMKCCYNCSKWNDGECEESPKSKTFFCADFKCDKWECMDD